MKQLGRLRSLLPFSSLFHLHSRIFYEDKELFRNQQVVCNIVSLLEDHWKVPSSQFNLLPANKGLFAGPIGISIRGEQPRWEDDSNFSSSSSSSSNSSRRSTSEDRETGTISSASSPTAAWGVKVKVETDKSSRSSNSNSNTPLVLNKAFSYKQELIIDPSRIASMLQKPDIANISWVLVVEKETCFADRVQELNGYTAQRSSAMAHHGHGIILTVIEQSERDRKEHK